MKKVKIMINKEKNNKDFEAMTAALENAFDIYFYKSYIKFRLNPETIEESEMSKTAFEQAREGVLKRFKKAFPGKSENEYQKMLDKCCRPDLLHVLEQEDAKMKHFSFPAEKLMKMAEKLPPISEANNT